MIFHKNRHIIKDAIWALNLNSDYYVLIFACILLFFDTKRH